MGGMPVTLSVRKVPAALVERLRQRVANHHRSLQDELLAILDAAASPTLTIDELAARARALGLKTPADSVEIIRATRDGRRD